MHTCVYVGGRGLQTHNVSAELYEEDGDAPKGQGHADSDINEVGSEFRNVLGQCVGDGLLQIVKDQSACGDTGDTSVLHSPLPPVPQNFLFPRLTRPCSTPVTMEAKLSSSRIMSAAFLAASEPAMPMATPMSAFFRAGESFTPSPVTATIAPCRQ